jgi:large subunit ribosomal protein L25
MVPASVFGPTTKPINIVIDAKEFRKVFVDSGYSNFIDLDIDGQKPSKVLVKELSIHPIQDNYLHVGFYLIDETRKITVDVPVNLVGEAPAVKLNLGFLVQQLEYVKLHCLPKDLPQMLEVSVSELKNTGDAYTVGQLVLPANVELDSSMENSTAIAYIAAAQKEIVEEVKEAAPATEASTPATAPAAAEAKK